MLSGGRFLCAKLIKKLESGAFLYLHIFDLYKINQNGVVLSDELCLNTISNEIADEQPAGSKWRRVIVYDYDYSPDDEFEDEIDEL